MFVKIHGLHKLKIRLYTKLVSNLVDDSLFLNCFGLRNLKSIVRRTKKYNFTRIFSIKMAMGEYYKKT